MHQKLIHTTTKCSYTNLVPKMSCKLHTFPLSLTHALSWFRGLAPRRSTSRLDTGGKPPRQTRRLPLHHTSPLGISRNHRSFPPHRSTSPYRTPRKSPLNQLPRCSSVFLRGKPRTGLGCLYRPYWNKCQLGNPCSSRAESHRTLPRTSLRGTAHSR